MPGVVMDRNNFGEQGRSSHDQINGTPSTPVNIGPSRHTAEIHNGFSRINGARHVDLHQSDETLSAEVALCGTKNPPELQRITQGFFPLSKLVNRSVQQCWNDLTDMINELADIQLPSHNPSVAPVPNTRKVPGNQSAENVQKKLRALEFAQTKRGEFIKLLVLSQWSRQAADVSRLIDIQNFIRIQHQSYSGALQCVGDMKRDLVRAQVANPDLRTALEVLSKGEVVSMPDLGYRPPKHMTPKNTIRKLRKINRIISGRLALHEDIPLAFQTYRVHDGRVTFTVSGEFELDLSVGQEDNTSQFYFVDIRFLFRPSPSAPTGRVFSELDLKINDILQNSGLSACFCWLHNLVLTNKVNILARQASELTRGLWSNVLRVELLHRTLVLQYWASKSGTKSWLEIGIRRGSQNSVVNRQHLPSLGLRWMRDGQEADSKDIEFDTEELSVEGLLRSVIALHISHILSSVFREIGGKFLYTDGSLSLCARITKTEPGDCQLDVQLTASRKLRVAIEPMSGAVILAATPITLERIDTDRNADRSTIAEIASRIGRLRCAAAIEEVESQFKILGFESINPRNAKIDTRRVFPANVLRFSFFSHRLWERAWLLAATSSMDGDNWWVIQTRSAETTADEGGFGTASQMNSIVCSAQIVCNTLFPVQQVDFSALADLGHCLSGILAIYANARFLEGLQFVKSRPSLDQLKIGFGLRVPDLYVEYEPSKLPQAFRIGVPAGFKKKAFIKRTLRLAFHGVDWYRNVAIVVAHGNLSTSSQAFADLISKDDRSLVFQKSGTGFALRLLASPGSPIIINLFENLQRLECALSIYEILRQKKMDARSLSLSRIDFAYGPDRDLLAFLDIGKSQSQYTTGFDFHKLASSADHLFRLRLGIGFGHLNPHRRIQSSLASNLNRPASGAGLETLAELLSFTLPLMRALDRLMANPAYNEQLRMHVTVRNATYFQIHFPSERCQFQLVAHQRQNQPVWILKEVSYQDGSDQSQLKQKLQESLYNSNGLGWSGLGNGAFAQPDSIGNLLGELEKCLASLRANTASGSSSGNKPIYDGLAYNDQSSAEGPVRPDKRDDTREGAGNGTTEQKADALPQRADFIMID